MRGKADRKRGCVEEEDVEHVKQKWDTSIHFQETAQSWQPILLYAVIEGGVDQQEYAGGSQNIVQRRRETAR